MCHMSLEKLRAALIGMPPTGDAGFEGLVAVLLSAVTGDRFYVARSGDQPADAIASAADVAIQAKRYDKTVLDETQFEGEFAQACRLIPNLDSYVFAATRQTAQLRLLASAIQNREGVDIILLEFDAADSELPALCVTFWDKVRHFTHLAALDDAFAAWAAAQAAERSVAATVNRLREQLTTSVAVAATVRRRLHSYLEIRFGINANSKRAVRFPIDLPKAVAREKPHLLLNNWWTEKSAKAALLVGDEGMGKSVVAAAFSRELSLSASALVLWLDGADWAGIRSIDGVVNSALKHAGFGDQRLRDRLVQKALKRWPSNLLIVLDGVNEKSARETAHHLLADLDASEMPTPRLLFTSRRINWRSDEGSLWQTTCRIPVEPFTDKELGEALAGLTPPISIDELPTGLLEVAKIPRFFKRAVQLREQLRSLRHVSREMVLWADLLDKVRSGDPQVTEAIGWKSPADLKRAMTTLASAALTVPAGSDAAPSESYSVLQKCFGDKFERTRLDLAEQRIVLDPTGDHPSLNQGHVVLGFALHLGSIASAHPNENVHDLADRLRKELEPLLSQDYLTEALFVALQLSALPTREPYVLTPTARAALLFTWASSQNSKVEDERLSFWANHDTTAYLNFVEELFVQPVSDGWSSQVIAPLKALWSRMSDVATVDSRLRSWLKLVWRHDLQSLPQLIEGKHSLPIARSQPQLVLSNVALAVLAEKPISTFLPDLAIAAATDQLSRQQQRFTDPTTQTEKTHDFPCKDLDNNLGPVLRWRFTEQIKPALEALLAEAKEDPVLAKGVNDLLTSFDLFGWRWGGPNPGSLRDRERLFPGTAEESKNRFADVPDLAARDDLPEIAAEDQAIISEKVENAFSSPQLRQDVWYSSAAMDLDHYLAWFAKYRPQRLAEIGATLRLKALSRDKAWLALDLANDLPYSRETVPPGELLMAAKELVRRTPEDAAERYEASLLEAHVTAFTCFGADELKDWLLFAARHKRARAQIHFWQIHVLCRYLLEEVALFARAQARQCSDEDPDESNLSSSEFDYWAVIGGTAGPADLDFHSWVDAQLRQRLPTGHRRFYWRLLWFRTAPDELLTNCVANGSIFEMLGEDGKRGMFFANRTISDWTGLTVKLDQLLQLVPLDEVGSVLLRAKRSADLTQWGHLIFTEALNRVGHAPFPRNFWGTTIFERDASGRIAGSDCDRGRSDAATEPEGLRPRQASFRDHLNQVSIEDQQREANAALKVWHADLHRLRAIDNGALSEFNALAALQVWRDEHPKEFREYSRTLLESAVAHPAEAYHIGGFVAAVVDALIPLEPEFAYEIHTQLQGSPMRMTMRNEYGESTFTAALWASTVGGNQRTLNICRQLCHASSTDEELASLAVTALAEGAEKTLLLICGELLRSPLARERALAVSLLAWIPDDAEIKSLTGLVENDPSGWIRRHAAWASEVARHERAVRVYYRDTLRITDQNAVGARLQVLRPALTLSAQSWHREIEGRELANRPLPRETEAALAGFWYNFRSRSKKAPKMFSRDLREYLRGECIRDLRMPKPRLT